MSVYVSFVCMNIKCHLKINKRLMSLQLFGTKSDLRIKQMHNIRDEH